MEILAVEDLTFSYPQCISPALRNASLRLERGELAVLCGATGSGKSTLLRMLKRELIPNGEMSGRVMFCGSPLGELSARDSASRIGFVMQRPEQQIVTDKVWHELAFGLENLGVPQEEIARRTAEIASYFGIISWYGSDTAELSGGQKQLLNLAAVLVMQPELLILDAVVYDLIKFGSAAYAGSSIAFYKVYSFLEFAVVGTERQRDSVNGGFKGVVDAHTETSAYVCEIRIAVQ